jgi:hypothetical protein
MEDSLADQAKGGQGNHIHGYGCDPYGMPMMTIAFQPQEYIITPGTTHILVNHQSHTRRIYTDGRDWPTKELEPTYSGYSIGRWIDEDGDGRYDVLEVETRGPFKVLACLMAAGCRCTTIISRFSRSGSISTKPILTSSITR